MMLRMLLILMSLSCWTMIGRPRPAFSDEVEMLVDAENPDPSRLPSLGVWRDTRLSPGRELTMVSAVFPDVPGLVADSWCYESEMDFLGASALDEGRLELRHRLLGQKHVVIVTTVTPESGAVEFLARAVSDPSSGEQSLPEQLPPPNLCWQLRRAAGFRSATDPYPDFVKRCFLFTHNGRTFLDQTVRRKIPVRTPDDPYNIPPWVQMYVGQWQSVPESKVDAWADYSPDRYTTRIMGVVSRDGKYLAALANDSATVIAQAWHDCLHNNAQWRPVGAPTGDQVWRLKMYALENDADALLRRVEADFPRADAPDAEASTSSPSAEGVRERLPGFYQRLADRMTFPLAWRSSPSHDFAAWRRSAREEVMRCLMPAPPTVPFEPHVVSEQDRGSYLARKVIFNITADSRVVALMLVPKGPGPHPAVLLLHDHGAKFDIGKEKVIRPWDEPQEKIESAGKWVAEYYGGRFIGDELARRGYVCLCTDMLNWSDRGGGGYENQQALAANLLQLGTSWAGLIAHEDLRAAAFLADLPEVDPRRVAAMGLSVGGYRTWQVVALSDKISAGVSVCWMATRKGLMVPGNNQTTGQSAFTMIHPGLSGLLDFPDVASIACPKPMMFLCGNRDTLFPVRSIEESFARMREVWVSQNAADRLVTRLYDAPHEFNRVMQDDAFRFLDQMLRAESGLE